MKKFNEFNRLNEKKTADELDITFFKGVFADFIDEDDTDINFDEYSFEIWITMPMPYVTITEGDMLSPIVSSIDDYIKISSNINNRLLDIETAIKRIQDNYPDIVYELDTFNNIIISWRIHITFYEAD